MENVEMQHSSHKTARGYCRKLLGRALQIQQKRNSQNPKPLISIAIRNTHNVANMGLRVEGEASGSCGDWMGTNVGDHFGTAAVILPYDFCCTWWRREWCPIQLRMGGKSSNFIAKRIVRSMYALQSEQEHSMQDLSEDASMLAGTLWHKLRKERKSEGLM